MTYLIIVLIGSATLYMIADFIIGKLHNENVVHKYIYRSKK